MSQLTCNHTYEHKWVLGRLYNDYRQFADSPFVTNLLFYCEKCRATKLDKEKDNMKLFEIAANQ